MNKRMKEGRKKDRRKVGSTEMKQEWKEGRKEGK